MQLAAPWGRDIALLDGQNAALGLEIAKGFHAASLRSWQEEERGWAEKSLQKSLAFTGQGGLKLWSAAQLVGSERQGTTTPHRQPNNHGYFCPSVPWPALPKKGEYHSDPENSAAPFVLQVN